MMHFQVLNMQAGLLKNTIKNAILPIDTLPSNDGIKFDLLRHWDNKT